MNQEENGQSQATPAKESLRTTPEPAKPTAMPDRSELDTVAENSVAPLKLSAQESANPAEVEESSHTVVAGDTLTRIATRYDVSVAALLRANDLPNPDLLEVGQIIKLPEQPAAYTSSFLGLPDSRLVRSIGASTFDIAGFLVSRRGTLRNMTVALTSTKVDGSQQTYNFDASQIVERVSLEYSVDARVMLAFLEHFAGLVTQTGVDSEKQLYPLIESEGAAGLQRAGLYNQLSWLADTLNLGYYDWKYRGKRILDFPDGSRLFYDPNLNAASAAVQYALAQLSSQAEWEHDISASGFYDTYRRLFGDPFESAFETVPVDLRQPDLTLPFPPGAVWRYTGGFHGGWGNGSGWAAIDFSPPDDAGLGGYCATTSHPTTAIAQGTIARIDEGIVVLDLDQDEDEGSGWSILYLHIDPHDSLQAGQVVEAGNILGYASCLGGFTTATHLHIARRYNGEWIPADCVRCPTGTNVPPFVLGDWRVVGLPGQLYQGFLVHVLDNRTVVAEQGVHTDINKISW